MTKNKPVHEVRFGCIKAAVWENTTGDGSWFSVTFSRSYKDGEEWKASESFGRDDLLVRAKAADEAHSWIHSQRAAAREAAQAGGTIQAAPPPVQQSPRPPVQRLRT